MSQARETRGLVTWPSHADNLGERRIIIILRQVYFRERDYVEEN